MLAYLISLPVIVAALIFAAFVLVAPGLEAREMIHQERIVSWPGRIGAVAACYVGILGGFLILAVAFGRAIDVVGSGG